jgi:hypothetical protein
MLLSSILQILDLYQLQRKTAEKATVAPFDIELTAAAKALGMEAAAEKEAAPEECGSAPAAKADLLKPAEMQQAPSVSAQNLENLLRAITIFEKPEQRVVDVFE